MIDLLLAFAFFYPLLMSYVWMGGGLLFWFRRERESPSIEEPPELPRYPLVSLVVPCYNEGDSARETIAALDAQRWPHFEILAVDDGSRDHTGEILDELLDLYPRLRVVHLSQNEGKAMGLRTAAAAARGEFLVCIDGDAILDPWATHWLVSHLVLGPRVGAVTGNPRIRNRSTFLGRLQVGEFSSIIGLIKRAQRSYGRIFTVSGVIAAFRATALRRIEWWSNDMVTEDIDVTWRLQMDRWDVRYEPRALCWILVPETLRDLWKQRLRWAQGGAEVALRYGAALGRRLRHRRLWVVLAEYLASVAWSYVMLGLILLWLLGTVAPLPEAWRVSTLLPDWHGVILGSTCLLQFAVSLLVDRRYETKVGRNYYWMIWYPFAFWILSMLTTVVATPKALAKRRGTRATWVSPERRGVTVKSPEPATAPAAWPPIVHRPERQGWWNGRFYQLITLLAWAGWAYLFLPLLTLLAWLAGLQAVWVETELTSRAGAWRDLDGIALAALVSAAILIVWGDVERRRFTRRPLRPIAAHDEVQTVSEGMEIRPRDVHRLRDARRTLVDFTPGGRVLRVVVGRPGEASGMFLARADEPAYAAERRHRAEAPG